VLASIITLADRIQYEIISFVNDGAGRGANEEDVAPVGGGNEVEVGDIVEP